MTDNFITLYNITLYEPMTVFTDLLIAFFCFRFFQKIEKNEANWRFFFLFLSFSTFFAAISHGFFAVHEGVGYKTVWLVAQAFGGFSIFNGVCATFLDSEKKAQMQLGIYTILLFAVQKFWVVIINNAFGLIPMMYWHFRNRSVANFRVAMGIVVTFFAAGVHAFKLSLHTFFNYNDIAHLILLASLSLMFWGVRTKALEIAPPSVS